MRDERVHSLGHWLYLRLTVTSLVLTAGVLLLILAADGVPQLPLYSCLVVQYAVAGIAYLAVRAGVGMRAVQVVQAVLDLLIITAIVHFTGGIGSRFTLLYFFPVLLAAFDLKRKGALVTAGLASLLLLSYALAASSGVLVPPAIVYREGLVSNGDFMEVHLGVSLLLVVGYLSGELAGRIERKARLLARRREELARARRETRSILDNMSSGVLTLDMKGVVQRVNPAAARILGVGAELLEGRPVADALGAIMPIFVGHLMECIIEGQPAERVEIHVERQDGAVIPLGLSMSQQLDAEGRPVGVIAVFQDLSSVLLMRERIRANDRLAAMGELSASIAHEIRNPLASIRGSVEMLSAELELDGENARLMDLVRAESDRLNRIATDFLDYARLKPVQPRNCRLTELLDELETMLRSRDDLPAGFKLDCGRLPDDVVVSVDEELMKQVFLNLALNAIEAMAAHGGTLSILVSLRPEEKPPELVVRFLDEGPGIQLEDRERLFEPFFTTKPQGTGLGLPLANRIVSNHDGRIAAHNLDGGGAEFAVHLPLIGFWRDGKLVRGIQDEKASGVAAV